jgi:hypothetical protein
MEHDLKKNPDPSIRQKNNPGLDKNPVPGDFLESNNPLGLRALPFRKYVKFKTILYLHIL